MGRERHRILPIAAPALVLATGIAGFVLPMPAGGTPLGTLFAVAQLAILAAAVFASVHHADVIAHRTGEPYGTLVLTIAVTIIEVALILAIMLAGDGTATLARDTVFAVVMVVCNGLVGLCLLAGGIRYGEVGFRVLGARAYLVVLMPLAVLTLVLPNFTTSAAGPYYTSLQLAFVAAATLVLYLAFLYVQTVRHRDYFLSDAADDDDDGHVPDDRAVARSFLLLVVALAGIVLIAKQVADSLKLTVLAVGAPLAVLGLLVALLVLLPESVAALRAARRNQLQKSLNLALGSSLATIGLTIPAVGLLAIALGTPLALGLDARDAILLVLTFGVSLVTFGGGQTNILPGFVHLVLFATYVFLIFAP